MHNGNRLGFVILSSNISLGLTSAVCMCEFINSRWQNKSRSCWQSNTTLLISQRRHNACSSYESHLMQNPGQYSQHHTVNREIFVVKYFRTARLAWKLNSWKIIRITNCNAVRGRLSENYLTRKFNAWNISYTNYLQFTVL